VYIWRKLKRIGAIFFQDAVWVLPNNPRTEEQFQWLAAEIIENGGEATLWEADLALKGQDDLLEKQFAEQVDRGYVAILKQLQEANPDLESLSREYQHITAKDYFQSQQGKLVRERLLAAREVDE
jgi:hypothetical protein